MPQPVVVQPSSCVALLTAPSTLPSICYPQLCGFYIQPMQGAAPASGVVAVLAAAVIGALGFIPT